MSYILFGSIFLILFTYIFYPLFVLLMGFFIKKRVKKEDIHPTVAILIAAYNEEKGIEDKIKNTLELEYPKDKIEIIVVSDGSTDQTDEIVKKYGDRGVQLFRVEGRVGKTEARNQALMANKQEIIVFSDGTTYYNKNAILKLVRNFADPHVGLVSGHLTYFAKGKTNVGLATKVYWKYEGVVKKAQNNLGTLTGAIGCINAFRREHYTPLPPNIIEDFTEPLMFVLKGWRVVYEEEARSFEETTQKVSQELNMRIRVIRGGVRGLLFARQILNPFKTGIWIPFQLISHKVIRWLVPIFALLTFGLSVILSFVDGSFIYTFLFLGQLLFYLMALIAFVLDKWNIHIKLFNLPLYFCAVNLASLIALYKICTTELEATWETDR